MRISLKLMGMLRQHAPENGELELPEHATIEDVIKTLKLQSEAIQVFSVNGAIERDRQRQLNDADELTILPPVGGGC